MNSKQKDLISLYRESLLDNWELKAFSDYGGESFYYSGVAEKILLIHGVLKALKVQKGDKIALLGKNSSSWGIIYLATQMYGAVIVPILPDFKPADVHYIVTHSDSVLLFVEDFIYPNLDPEKMPQVRNFLKIQDLTSFLLRDPSVEKDLHRAKEEHQLAVQKGITREQMTFPEISLEEIAVISYTSGTTGFSKGVVLQHKSLFANILYARRNMPLNPKDKILSFLPLAHTYGCAFEFLFPFTLGCDITFLTKTPSPKIIMQAFQEIRPALILSVPLVIEKIYKTQIIPAIRKPAVQILMRVPVLNNLIFTKIREKLFNVFGGNFKELVIGGAAFNTQAESFFRKIKFPFTVGYGMTECGPLISYASWKTTKLGASGRAVDELQVKIDSPDPYFIAGEICMKGSHVMLGYYKNEDATRQVLDADGWLHSGDLGVTDKDGNIYIKGRNKSMILGPSGKNIYPEEVESLLNNRFLVMESLVIERNDKLVALIYPDYDALERACHKKEDLPGILERYVKEANDKLPKYITISSFEIAASEFEKTPKRSIKRFLYK